MSVHSLCTFGIMRESEQRGSQRVRKVPFGLSVFGHAVASRRISLWCILPCGQTGGDRWPKTFVLGILLPVCNSPFRPLDSQPVATIAK